MQWISCHDGRLLRRESAGAAAERGGSFRTGLEALDALAPARLSSPKSARLSSPKSARLSSPKSGGAFARGAVHELLCDPAHGQATFLAMLLAKSAALLPLESEPATGVRLLPLIWSDPHRTLYPPALESHGIPLDSLFLLRASPRDQAWAVAECLRCAGVGAVVAAMAELSRVEARRLQLAAETGGGAGILLRPTGPRSAAYAAATRWLVQPAPAGRTTQRWTVQLLHGHGGRTRHPVTLEYCRENHLVRASELLAHRSNPKVARAS